MSGGKFDYLQYRITQIIDTIEQEIINNDAEPRPVDYFEPNKFSQETIDEFKKGVEYLKIGQVYAQRIDWLLSCDDSEESFHKRLKEDLNELKL